MSKITKEDFYSAFQDQFLEALLGGSPEGMIERFSELHDIDMVVVREVYEEQFQNVMLWMMANDELREKGESFDTMEETAAWVTRMSCMLLSMRFFLAGVLIARKHADATL